MADFRELASFIESSFRSVWSIELLLLLRSVDRPCSTEELVAMMRASSAVIENALESLVAAGLAGTDGEKVSYMPITPHVAELVEATAQLYASRPDAVRRLIVAPTSNGLAAFADAFRLKD